MRNLLILAFTLVSMIVSAQPGLVLHYDFDACDATDKSGNDYHGTIYGNANCLCGVEGDAFHFDGLTDSILIPEDFNLFLAGDFTFSFYFQPFGAGETADFSLLSFIETCPFNNGLYISYNPDAKNIRIELKENAGTSAVINLNVPDGKCWYHFTLVRKDVEIIAFLNGEEVGSAFTDFPVVIQHNGILTIGSGPCNGIFAIPYEGLMDDFYLFNRALEYSEINSLYYDVDKILTQDTIVYLGDEFDLRLTPTCSSNPVWSPSTTLDNPLAMMPHAVPLESVTYSVLLSQNECVARDTVKVTVIDPALIECGELYLPKAFTPNGDGLNDKFGISNAYLVDEMEYFDVYDRWGGKIFSTTDPDLFWDGSFNGNELNPGVYLYYISYQCRGESFLKKGSFNMIR